MTQSDRPIEMLLVEDNESDIRLTQVALEQANLANTLNVVRDGAEALAYLRKQGEYSKATRPDLVLLDLNLPKLNGTEVLKQIRDDKDLHSIPVVILTTSDAEQDIYESYEHHANCYITKPVDLKMFMGVIEMIEDFWARVASRGEEG